MALNSFKCNYVTPLHFKGLTLLNYQQIKCGKYLLKNRLPTQQEPHEPWSRTSFIVGQFGHWVRASKESGIETASSMWDLTGRGTLPAPSSTPHNRFTCSTDIPSKFTPACIQHHYNNQYNNVISCIQLLSTVQYGCMYIITVFVLVCLEAFIARIKNVKKCL